MRVAPRAALLNEASSAGVGPQPTQSRRARRRATGADSGPAAEIHKGRAGCERTNTVEDVVRSAGKRRDSLNDHDHVPTRHHWLD